VTLLRDLDAFLQEHRRCGDLDGRGRGRVTRIDLAVILARCESKRNRSCASKIRAPSARRNGAKR